MKTDSDPSQPSSQLSDYFAPLALRVITPRLTLQLPSGPELYQTLHVIERGIHDPSQMPFINAWTDLPSPRRERESLARWWRLRAEWTARDWRWSGAVHVEDSILGVQDLVGLDFLKTRQVKTASWLGLEYQGQGLGREMREAVLHLSGYNYKSIYGMNYRVKEKITMADMAFRIQAVIKTEVDVTEAQLSRNGIDVVHGIARFVDPHQLRVEGAQADSTLCRTVLGIS